MASMAAKSAKELTQELSALEERREQLERSLAQLERQIFALETSYLEDTNHTGNLLRGWDGYLSSRGASNKKHRFKEKDRLFSLSSVSSAGAQQPQPAQQPSASASSSQPQAQPAAGASGTTPLRHHPYLHAVSVRADSHAAASAAAHHSSAAAAVSTPSAAASPSPPHSPAAQPRSHKKGPGRPRKHP